MWQFGLSILWQLEQQLFMLKIGALCGLRTMDAAGMSTFILFQSTSRVSAGYQNIDIYPNDGHITTMT